MVVMKRRNDNDDLILDDYIDDDYDENFYSVEYDNDEPLSEEEEEYNN